MEHLGLVMFVAFVALVCICARMARVNFPAESAEESRVPTDPKRKEDVANAMILIPGFF